MKRETTGVIVLEGRRIPYRWIKKQVKNINLRVQRDGELSVSTPRHMTREGVEQFLVRNQSFILRALARRAAQEETVPTEPLFDGGRIPILGRSIFLRISEESPYGVTMDADCLWIRVRSDDGDHVKRELREWMGRRMEEWMPRLCAEALRSMERYGIKPPVLKYRCMVSRWGSCCKATGEITFNKFLMCVPVRCVEYVVYHEMAHLVEANHSPSFYRILSEIMPDWKERREELTHYGEWIRHL